MQTALSSDPQPVGALASVVLRLAIASLFLAAATGKLRGGAETITRTVAYFQTSFENTWLPRPLVTAHAYVVTFAEPLIVLWLVSGLRLKIAWTFAGLFTTTLAFGMSVARQYESAADDYGYVLICVVGLYLSRYDRLTLDRFVRKGA